MRVFLYIYIGSCKYSNCKFQKNLPCKNVDKTKRNKTNKQKEVYPDIMVLVITGALVYVYIESIEEYVLVCYNKLAFTLNYLKYKPLPVNTKL